MTTPKTLLDSNITTTIVSRRSALTMVGALGAAGAIAVTVGATRPARAERPCTDSDDGAHSDTPGHGRGHNVNDSDSGSNADASGCGRGTSSCSDSDPSDGAGHGSHCR